VYCAGTTLNSMHGVAGSRESLRVTWRDEVAAEGREMERAQSASLMHRADVEFKAATRSTTAFRGTGVRSQDELVVTYNNLKR
jgi:hypothetical protein